MDADAVELERAAALVADGVIKVDIDSVLPLNEVQRAHAISESRRARGKIVLTV
jgi:NADPH:quinone reductase-like Zn-dependent oxidoreductase